MLASPSNHTMHNPCLAFRRPGFSPPLEPITIPRESLDHGKYDAAVETSESSNNKRTGSPGYITTSSRSLSPTKVHPSKPHHVRGGSIGSDLSDVSSIDQVIPMQPCDAEMMVPLLHRHLEMKELIEANPAQFCRLRNSIGTRVFVKCLDLWTETTRAEKSDARWLRETQSLLKDSGDWALWCEIVGWDHHDMDLTKSRPVESQAMADTTTHESDADGSIHARQMSTGSLNLLAKEEIIHEEPED